METGSKIVMTFGIGLVAGAVVGLILAPASGEETRENLTKISRNSIDYFLEQAVAGLSVARDIMKEMHENRIDILS